MRINNLLTLGLLPALIGIGCASEHHHADGEKGSTSPSVPAEERIIIVNGDANAGPPPLRVDGQPPQPAGSANWISGHWLHDPQLNAWIWVPGRWR